MLDPKLRARSLEEFFDLGAAGERLLLVELEVRHVIGVALFVVMIEVARDQHRPGLLQFQEQHLMAGRVAWRGLDDHGSVAEDIVIGVGGNDFGFAVLERAVVLFDSHRRGFVGKHDVALGLLDQPRGTGEHVGVGGVIDVVMREREVLDVFRLIAHGLELRLQRLRDLDEALRRERHRL